MESLKDRSVLVTGATGFIGSHLTRKLVEVGASVVIFSRENSNRWRIRDIIDQVEVYDVDIRESGAVRAAIERIRPDVVFHLAAEGVHDPFVSEEVAQNVNFNGTLNIVRAGAESGAIRIILTGTSYEYGEKSAERQMDPISPYAASKAATWSYCRMYYRTASWPIVYLRLFQVYGPGQVGTIVPTAIRAAIHGEDFPTTEGEQIRDWVYIDDVIDAYLKAAITPDIEGDAFDIGSGDTHSVRTIVEKIFDQFDQAQPKIGALSYRPGEVWELIAHTEETHKRLNWEPTVSVEDGIQRTVEAFRQEHERGQETSVSSPATDKSIARSEVLRAEILDRVSEYYDLVHQNKPWIPGQGRVQYAGRVFDAREMKNMTDSVLEFWLTAGHFADEFESKLGKFLGVREVIPVNSGSSANLVAVTTLKSKKLPDRPLVDGDEIITTALAFPTTVAPIVQNRLIPVMVDSQMGNYNIDVEQLEAALSDRTRALVVTHTLGNPVEMDAIMNFAEEHDLYVIEDNCDSLGSTYDGRMTGTFGHMGTSSFYPAHHITLGEGGAVYTNSPRIAKAARTIRDWGRDCWCGYTNLPDGQCGKRFDWTIDGLEGYYDHRYLFTEIGYNLKITDPQAAVGVAQVDKLPDFVSARKRNFNILYEGLKTFEEFFVLPTWSGKADPCWFAFPLTLRPDAPFDRNSLQRHLEHRNIETRLLFAGNILKHPGYRHVEHRVVGDLPVANTVMAQSMFIGVYPGLTPAQLEYVLEAFDEFIKSKNLATA